jgi:dCTP deaminase
MAFWGKDRWLAQGLGELAPVSPWDEGKVEAAGYRLSVGREYFINGDGSSTVNRLDTEQAFVIEPGQFAFILTKEKVYISRSAIGFISIRASTKFRGLVNVSGFQVNPGHAGNLIFAVFNAGPRHISLRESDEIFSLWIADLDADVSNLSDDKGNISSKLDKIPSDIINNIAGPALTAYQVSKKVAEVEKSYSERLTKVEQAQGDLKVMLWRIVITLGFVLTVALVVFRQPLLDLVSGENEAAASNTAIEASE